MSRTRQSTKEMDEQLQRIMVRLQSLEADMNRLGDFFASLDAPAVTLRDAYDIRPRRLLLESKFTTYEQTLLLYYTTAGQVEPPESYEALQNRYFSSLASADRALARLNQPPTPPVSTAAHIPLPKIHLPTFDGQIEDWPGFITLYDAIVHANTSLEPSQKFHYLRSSLTGEASSVIAGFTLIASNYLLAYDALRRRYQNDRRLAHLYFGRILSFQSSRAPSLETLKRFQTVHRNAIEGLKALPIDDLADFLLFSLTLNNLDTISRQRFEDKLPSDAIPQLSQLLEFVNQQVRVFENSSVTPGDSATARQIGRAASPPSRLSTPSRKQWTTPLTAEITLVTL